MNPSEGDQPSLPSTPQGKPAVTWTLSGSSRPVLFEWAELLSDRLRSLAYASVLEHRRDEQRQIFESLGTLGQKWSPEIYEIAHVPTDEEHSALLEKVWMELIKAKEPAAWGVYFRSRSGDLKFRPIGDLTVATAIPPVPGSENGQELVIVVRDPNRPTNPALEPATSVSAEKRLDSQEGVFNYEEWTYRIMNEPFRELERIRATMLEHLDGEIPLSVEQKHLADEIETHFIRAMARAGSLLSSTDDDPEISIRPIKPLGDWQLAVQKLDPVKQVSAWLAFVSQVIGAFLAFQKFEQAMTDDEVKAARERMKFQDNKGAGRRKDSDRKDIVAEMVLMLKQDPSITCDECVAALLKKEMLRESKGRAWLRLNREQSRAFKRTSFNKWFTEACRLAGVTKRRRKSAGNDQGDQK